MTRVIVSLSTILQLTHARAGYNRGLIDSGILLGQTDDNAQCLRLCGALPMPMQKYKLNDQLILRRAHHYLATRSHLRLIGSYAIDSDDPLLDEGPVHMRIKSCLFDPPSTPSPDKNRSFDRTGDVLINVCLAANKLQKRPASILSYFTFFLSGAKDPIPNSQVELEYDFPAVLVLQSLFSLRINNDIGAFPLGRSPKVSLIDSPLLEQLAVLHVPTRHTRVRRALEEDVTADLRDAIAKQEEEIEQAETGHELALAMAELRELTMIVSSKR